MSKVYELTREVVSRSKARASYVVRGPRMVNVFGLIGARLTGADLQDFVEVDAAATVVIRDAARRDVGFGMTLVVVPGGMTPTPEDVQDGRGLCMHRTEIDVREPPPAREAWRRRELFVRVGRSACFEANGSGLRVWMVLTAHTDRRDSVSIDVLAGASVRATVHCKLAYEEI